MIKFYWYPKCSTCKKAKSWLDEHDVAYQTIDLVTETPDEQTIKNWLTTYDLPIKKYFNTSGIKYRELGLKDQVEGFNINQAAKMLASDGMLIKRPVVTDDQGISLGFKAAEFSEKWLKK